MFGFLSWGTGALTPPKVDCLTKMSWYQIRRFGRVTNVGGPGTPGGEPKCSHPVLTHISMGSTQY